MSPPYLSRGIRRADPFGRLYGIGTVTVVIGVVTVAAVPVGVVTVAVVIGVWALVLLWRKDSSAYIRYQHTPQE